MLTIIAQLPVVQAEPDPNSVTPGAIGFVAIAVIGVLTLLLVLDMVRRLRRVRYRAQVREEIEQERLAGQAGEGSELTRPKGPAATTPGEAGPGDEPAG